MAGVPYRVSLQPDIEFELPDGDGWKLYRVSGDPDVEVVATLLELEDIITGGSAEDEIADAVVRGRDLLLRLVRERMPDVEEIHVGVSAMLQVFSFIVGDASAAAAVADLIASAGEIPAGDEDPEAAAVKRAEAEAGGGAEDAEPVPLDKPSRSSSSRSGTRKTGRRTGGKAARGESSASTSEKRRAAAG